jgi:hypothetical protein
MTNPDLAFLPNEAGEREGLGDAGIETFKNSPYASAAREAGQNSRDAAETLPVKLTFDVLEVTPAEIPSHEKMVRALESCSAASKQDKEIEFFANAVAVAKAEKIPVLRIADFNTYGLKGPADEVGTPFHSLLKSSGVSTKENEGSGGSFGIGKNASFAVSELQMVMYSTIYDACEGTPAFASQGKIKLVSHIDTQGNAYRATGYWGHPEGFVAVTDPSLTPEWLRRQTKGTSIFCLGFRQIPGWAALMTSSLVSNFFCALHRNEMVFEIDSGSYNVNANTVEALLVNQVIREAADRSGQLPDLDFAGQLYRCLVSQLATEDEIDVPEIGRFRVRILVEKGMPRRIGFVRNGMFITDNLRHFGHPLKKFPNSRDFVALVEPIGDDSGPLMKRLENPAHDELSAARIANKQKREAAEKGMKKLGDKLRDLVKKLTAVEETDSVVLEELAHLFAQNSAKSSPPQEKGEPDPETYRQRPVKRNPTKVPPPPARAPKTGSKGGGGDGGGGGGGGGGEGPRRGGGKGGSGEHGEGVPVELTDTRNTLVSEGGNPRSRRVHFTPAQSGRIAVAVMATGINNEVVLELASVDHGAVHGSELLLDVEAGKRVSAVLTFSEPYSGPIELTARMAEQQEQD